jgi:hypothetical protein
MARAVVVTLPWRTRKKHYRRAFNSATPSAAAPNTWCNLVLSATAADALQNVRPVRGEDRLCDAAFFRPARFHN